VRSKDEQNEYSKQYYKDHKKEKLELAKLYYQKQKANIAEKKKVYYQSHKEDIIVKKKKHYLVHKIEKAEYNKEYRQVHKLELSEHKKKYYQGNKIEITVKLRKYSQNHREKAIRYGREYRQKRKCDILTHYGNGKCVCVRCGFDDIRALCIDHINGDGAKHRKQIGDGDNVKGGAYLYRWLQINKYPEGFQTLCFNCNQIKKVENKEVGGGKHKSVVQHIEHDNK